MNLMQILTNENPILINIITIIFSMPEAFLFYRLFSLILDIKDYSKRDVIVFVILMTLYGSVSAFLPNSLTKDILVLFMQALSMKLLFRISVRNVFIALLISYISALISEYTATSIFIYIFNVSHNDIVHKPLYFAIALLCTLSFMYLIILVIKLIKNKKMISVLMNKVSLNISLITNLIFGIVAILVETYLFSLYIDIVPLQLALSTIATTLIYFAISMYTLVRTKRLEKTEEDLANEKIYNKTLTLLHDNIRGFKHDFNNIVQAIGGYVALNDMNGLSDYYQHLLEECKLTNNLNLLNPEAINNPSIYSLLTNKYFIATEKGITMRFSIFSDLSKINFNMYELSRIMGILLDNAIEAAEESQDKIIDIEFKSDNKKQLFIIKNTCKDTNISTTRIFEKGYSTKNRNSGFGLWNVHKILSKNTNLDLYTSIEDNMFSQQFAVYY